jgi:hypothetical protein
MPRVEFEPTTQPIVRAGVKKVLASDRAVTVIGVLLKLTQLKCCKSYFFNRVSLSPSYHSP